MQRVLVVNADDFGLSMGVNRGIVRAHEHGIVTSASLMVLRPGAEDAAAYARQRPQLGVGLHLEPGDAAAQLERFRELVGGDPTHLDSHHHVHLREPLHAAALELAAALGVPLRSLDPRVRYSEAFFGRDAVTVEALLAILRDLPPGVTELGCHPGLDPELDSSYVSERALEVETLCDPRVREAIERQSISLASFADVTGGTSSAS